MNSAIYFWSIPVLTIIACIITFYGHKLYEKIYKQHITFEPCSKAFVPHAAFFITFMVSNCVAPALFWYLGLDAPFFFLCGNAIGLLASMISRAASSICIYKYVQKYPNSIEGHVIIKAQLTRVLNTCILLQHSILLGILLFFIPINLFIIGILYGLVVMALVSYFSKNQRQLNF